MTNSYPPYWEGQIGISFTREEWKYIKYVLQDDFVQWGGILPQDAHEMQSNIIDRIEKNLGIE
jgi:hypothetical protein